MIRLSSWSSTWHDRETKETVILCIPFLVRQEKERKKECNAGPPELKWIKSLQNSQEECCLGWKGEDDQNRTENAWRDDHLNEIPFIHGQRRDMKTRDQTNDRHYLFSSTSTTSWKRSENESKRRICFRFALLSHKLYCVLTVQVLCARLDVLFRIVCLRKEEQRREYTNLCYDHYCPRHHYDSYA